VWSGDGKGLLYYVHTGLRSIWHRLENKRLHEDRPKFIRARNPITLWGMRNRLTITSLSIIACIDIPLWAILTALPATISNMYHFDMYHSSLRPWRRGTSWTPRLGSTLTHLKNPKFSLNTTTYIILCYKYSLNFHFTILYY